MDSMDSLVKVVTRRDRTGHLIVRVQGELDIFSVYCVRAEVATMRRAGLGGPRGAAILDLSELQFADAAGLRGLVAAYRTLAETSEIVEVIPPLRENVRKVMSLTGVHRHLGALAGRRQDGLGGPTGAHAGGPRPRAGPDTTPDTKPDTAAARSSARALRPSTS